MLVLVSGYRSVPEMIQASPALLASTADFGDSWALIGIGVLNVYDNLSDGDAERIAGGHVEQVQFARRFAVTPATLRAIDDRILARHPRAHLRATLNGFGAFDDLEFLRYLPSLRSLGFQAYRDVDITPIKRDVALETLGVGGFRISLQVLRGYPTLTSFGFGEKVKDLDSIGTFVNLRSLSITSQTLRHLRFLEPLRALSSLSFALGGTTAFADLADLPALEELSIWRTRKLEIDHLRPLNGVKGLRRLHLHELPRIDKFDWLTHPALRTVELESMRGLDDYASLRHLPKLEILIIKNPVDARALSALRSFPSLKEVRVWESALDHLRKDMDVGALPFATVGI